MVRPRRCSDDSAYSPESRGHQCHQCSSPLSRRGTLDREKITRRKVTIEFLPEDGVPDGLKGLDLYKWYYESGRKTGLVWDTAESLVFTEDIKNGGATRDAHIENYRRSLRDLGKFGVENVVGNFMLVADWTRTGTVRLDDGSLALEYIHDAFAAFDLLALKRHESEAGYVEDGSYEPSEIEAARTYWNRFLADDEERRDELAAMITAGLPGAQEGFTLNDFRSVVSRYKGMSVDRLREKLAYFLDAVVPTARDAGVRLCCYSDDPAFSPFFGTHRAAGCADGYKCLLDHGCGVNLCIGSLIPMEKPDSDLSRPSGKEPIP